MTFIDPNGIATPVESWLLWIIIIAVAVCSLGFYALRSIGLFVLSKRQNVGKPILAFVPIAWVYLAGQLSSPIRFFGRKFKAFPLVMLIIALVSEITLLFINVMLYIPIIGCYFQGGEILISPVVEFFPEGQKIFTTSIFYICAPVNYPYPSAFMTFLSLLNNLHTPVAIAYIVFEISLYSAFFRAYLPKHSMAATVFSIFGIFAPFAFAVRKNEKFDYEKYMRAQYAAFYGMHPQSGQNPFTAQQPPRPENKEQQDPFEEFSDKKEEPFDEFK